MSNLANININDQIMAKAKDKREQIIQFTQELVRTKSVNSINLEEDVAHILIKKLEEIGFELQVYEFEAGRPNIIATIQGEEPGLTLLCYSHMDTVPEWDASLWSTDPFGGEIIDGNIYGRGTCDHKSEIVCLITAFEILKEMGTSFKGELVFIFDSDEEKGGASGMQELIKRDLVKADLGLYACTTQITTESLPNFKTSEDVNIIRATAGLITYKFTVPGTKPHPRYLMNLENTMTPSDHAAILINKLHYLSKDVSQRFDENTGNAKLWINSIHTSAEGEYDRPDEEGLCVITVSRRVNPSENIDKAEQDILLKVKETEQETNIDIKQELVRKRSAAFVPKNSRIIQEIVKAAKVVDGKKPKTTGVAALTGNGWFVNEAQIPTVMFGYGYNDYHHAIDEHIAITDLIKNTQVYAIIINNILS